MATPRKRWFKVADAILREPWTREQKLMMVLLAAHLNQRWARDGLTREEAGEAVLNPGVLMEITGRSHRGYAQKSLRTLEEVMKISVRPLGEHTEISWPNFPEFQDYPSCEREATGQPPAREKPPPFRVRVPSPEEEKKERGAPAPGVLPLSTTKLSEEVLREIGEAFSSYGKEIRSWGTVRCRLLCARMRENGGDPAVLASAVHGYAWYHRTRPGKAGNGFDPLAHLTPETIFRGSNFSKYLDAAHAALKAGKVPPFPLGAETSAGRADRLAGEILKGGLHGTR